MRRNRWLLWLVPILAVILVLFLYIALYRPTSEQSSLGPLSRPGCTPPCWNGLYPGMKISRSKLLTVLNELPDVRGIQTNTELPGDITFQWCPKGDVIIVNNQCNSYCHIFYLDGKVDLIRVDVHFQLTLGTIINVLGQPEYIDYTYLDDEISIYIRYSQLGCSFDLGRFKLNKLALSPLDIVHGAVYEINDKYKLGTYRQAWPGYGLVVFSPKLKEN
jgi:hypothetical protein